MLILRQKMSMTSPLVKSIVVSEDGTLVLNNGFVDKSKVKQVTQD